MPAIEIVSATSLYGGTYNLFHYTFPQLGIKVSSSIPPTRTSARPVTPQHQAFFGETIPTRRSIPWTSRGGGGRPRARLPLIVDNTIAAPT